MSSFYSVNPIAVAEIAELDEVALRHGGVLQSLGYGYGCPDHTSEIRGGWRVRWIDRRGMGNHGTAILIPTDARTRALWRDGQMCLFRHAGVPERYLAKLVGLRLPHKHELIAIIARVLSDSALLRAVLDFGHCDGGQGIGGERARWRAKWAPLVDDIALSGPRMDSLAGIIRAVSS